MSYFTMHCEKDAELENDLTKTYHKIGIKSKLRTAPLTEAEIEKIVNDDEAYLATVTYLDKLEEYCTAINTGLLDLGFMYHMYSPKYLGWYKELKPFIEYLRKKYNENTCYIEFERVIAGFRNKRYVELLKVRKALQLNKLREGASREV